MVSIRPVKTACQWAKTAVCAIWTLPAAISCASGSKKPRFAGAKRGIISQILIFQFDKLELVGAQPLHLAIARPFCRLKAPLGLSLLHFVSQTRTCRSETPPFCLRKNVLGCLLLAQTRTCRGAAPPSCYRKTVLSLAHPTGVCIVELHSTNANFAFDDQNENRYRCACFHKRCVT